MKYFRERVLEPVLIPLAALGVIAFGAVNMSRIFLASSHGDRAVITASLIAILILAGAVVATSVEKLDRGVLLGGAVALGLALTVAGFVAQEVDLDYIAEHSGEHGGGEDGFTSEIDVVAIDIDFPVKQIETANGGGIKVNYINEGAALHTFVVEGHEADLKLSTGGGETASGVIALDPGEYVFYCDVPGHRAAGMEGVMTVVEGEPGAGGGGGAAVVVPAADITFPEKDFEAAAGEVAFEYVNEGVIFHNLVVEGFEDEMVVEANGGETGRGSLALEPGVYTLYCAIPGHRGAGMEGTLTVT